MATFGRSDDLRGARFVEADMSGVVMRGVDLSGADIDSPWLFEKDNTFVVNGVDVLPYVDAELDRRFPGRADRKADTPEGLRAAWAALERTWAATLERVAAMPGGTVDIAVAGEWSFAQTLRHLVFATDLWLRKAILSADDPLHQLGRMDLDAGGDSPRFAVAEAGFADVLDARAGRVAMVRDFLGTVTAGDLAAQRRNPHDPERPETVLSCLHVILEEEWEHHRYAVRDLDTL